jgi:hypothetical protein
MTHMVDEELNPPSISSFKLGIAVKTGKFLLNFDAELSYSVGLKLNILQRMVSFPERTGRVWLVSTSTLKRSRHRFKLSSLS